MKRRILVLAVAVLPFSLSFAVLAQQTDLLNGEQRAAEVSVGFYVDDASGSQDWVREYDGRDFNGWGIEKLDATAHGGQYQMWLAARDLSTGDEDVSLDFVLRNDLAFRLSTSALTHRLAGIPSINPYLSQVINPGDGSPLAGINTVTGRPFGDASIELSPDTRLFLDRRVSSLNLKHYLGKSQNAAILADWWEEREHGNRQILFRNDANVRSSGPMAIDRTTSVSSLGTDFRLGSRSVLNYRVSSTDFADMTRPAIPDTFLDYIKPPSVKSSSNIIKARSRLSDRLYFTGVHTNRNRRNTTAVVPARAQYFLGSTVSNLGEPVNGGIDIESTNMALTFLASDTLSLTGRWRSYELDNFVPALVTSATSTSPANIPLSRKVDSAQLGASYSGIKNAFLRFDYERRDTERRAGELHPELEGLETQIIQESTHSDIVTLTMRYNPSLRLTLSGRAEIWNTDRPGYFGEPTDRTNASLNATYLVRDDFVLYGDISYSKDENNDIRSTGPFGDPTATTDEEELARELAAGQGYTNKFNAVNLGAWYGITGKLSADANFALISVDSSELWVFGHDPRYPPHLPVNTEQYRADNNQWSLGLNYTPKPKWHVFTRFLHSSSDGRATFSIIPGGVTLPDGWEPVDVTEKRWILGFGYDLSSTESLQFDYSTSDWTDGIDPGNNGRFNLWRIAWSTGF